MRAHVMLCMSLLRMSSMVLCEVLNGVGGEWVGGESCSDQYLWMRFMAWYGRIGVWADECVAEIRVLCANNGL